MKIFRFLYFKTLVKKKIKWEYSEKASQEINDIDMNNNEQQKFTECIDTLQ